MEGIGRSAFWRLDFLDGCPERIAHDENAEAAGRIKVAGAEAGIVKFTAEVRITILVEDGNAVLIREDLRHQLC